MKCFLLFLFIVIISKGEGLQLLNHIRARALLFQIQEKCILESGATTVDIAEIVMRTMPIRREGKCLISCILRNIGIQDKDIRKRLLDLGSTLLNRLNKDNPALYEQVMKVVGKCAADIYAKEPQDTCELAFEIVSCGVREGLTGGIENLFSVLVREHHQNLLPL